jgi:predicted hotdog family 3-hydroxylacyl-ACP dehydratase
VESFDSTQITCRANSHRDPRNPLRLGSGLSVQTGIEYAAQAVAAHGSLLDRQQQDGATATPRGGMIAVLTDIQWHTDRLDTVADDLTVNARKLADLPQGLNYRFTVSASQQTLLEGELIIALQPVTPQPVTPQPCDSAA